MILDGETKVPDLTKYSASNEEGAKLLQKLNDLKGTTLAKPVAKKKRKSDQRKPGRNFNLTLKFFPALTDSTGTEL
ncbi:hypothetical protein TYRP_020449 [Tyrophagus putrescentiae]|nr:hypothetical protein TYRP_020449 [Tyrophagus putrescentiae]